MLIFVRHGLVGVESFGQPEGDQAFLNQVMSVKSSIVIGLVGGAVGLGMFYAGWWNSASSRQMRLERRTYESAEKNPKSAENEYRDLIAEWTKLRGADFPDTLNCRESLAELLERQHRYTEAQAEYRAVLEGKSRTLGPRHPQTLHVRERFASFLERAGKDEDAEAELRILIQQGDAVKWLVEVAKRALTDNLDRQGKYDEELTMLQEKLKITEPDSEWIRLAGGPAVGETDFTHQVLLLREKIKLVEKKAVAKHEFEEAKRNLGENNPETLTLKSRLEELKKEQVRLPRKPRPPG